MPFSLASKFRCVSLILGLYTNTLIAQRGEATFHKQFSDFTWGHWPLRAYSIAKSGGKNFVLQRFQAEEFGLTAAHMNLMELNQCYNIINTYRIRCGDGSATLEGTPPSHDNLLSLENGDMIAGFNLKKGPETTLGGFMRISTKGQVIWSNAYCHRIAHFKIHTDGSIYFIGDILANDTTICLGQVSQDGTLLRAVQLNISRAAALDILHDGSLIAASRMDSSYYHRKTSGAPVIMRLSADLKILWAVKLSVPDTLFYISRHFRLFPRQVYGTKDNSVLVGLKWMHYSHWAHQNNNTYLLLIDVNGTIKWKRQFFTGDGGHGYSDDLDFISLKSNADRSLFYFGSEVESAGSNWPDHIVAIDYKNNIHYQNSYNLGIGPMHAGYTGLYPEASGELMFFNYRGDFCRVDNKGSAVCAGRKKDFTIDAIPMSLRDTSLKTDFFSFQEPVAFYSEKVNDITLKNVCSQFPLIRKIPRDTALCYGAILRLDAGNPGAERTWNTGDTTQVLEITKPGAYWVKTIDECYSSLDTVTVKFIQQTFVELGPDHTICSEDSTQLEAIGTVPGLTYQWHLPKKNVNGQPVVVKGNTLWAKDSGTYTVRVADAGGCLDLDTVRVNYYPLAKKPDAGPDTAICYGSTIEMKGEGGITYLWTPADYLDNAKVSNPKANPPSTQKYVLTISDTNGCVAHDTVWLKVKPPLQLRFNRDTIKTCRGNTVRFIAFASGGQAGQRKVEWQKQGDTTWIPGTSTNWKADSSYAIIVRVNDGCSKEYRDSVYIIAIDTPRPVLSIVPVTGCEPLTVQCKVEGDTANLIFHWDMGDGEQYHQPAPVHTYLKAGKYKVTAIVTDKASGCRSKVILPDEIEVMESPQAIMEIDPVKTDIFHPEIIFGSRSKNAVAIGWEMKGIRLSDKTPYTHTFADTGSFIMKLIAYHANGCTDTASGKVYIKEPFVVYIPNTFTPNRDGLNEPFRPVLMGIAGAPMQIYNRWGERVFEGDALKGWDGSFKGLPCSEGVYLYMIQVKGRESERDYYSGTVTLLR